MGGSGWVVGEGWGVCVGIVGGRVPFFGMDFSQSKNARLFNLFFLNNQILNKLSSHLVTLATPKMLIARVVVAVKGCHLLFLLPKFKYC